MSSCSLHSTFEQVAGLFCWPEYLLRCPHLRCAWLLAHWCAPPAAENRNYLTLESIWTFEIFVHMTCTATDAKFDFFFFFLQYQMMILTQCNTMVQPCSSNILKKKRYNNKSFLFFFYVEGTHWVASSWTRFVFAYLQCRFVSLKLLVISICFLK